ncbi:hypothetical protein [Chryseobacterium luteum]|nr:hypothetical protein [Chryseobacterium luteum]
MKNILILIALVFNLTSCLSQDINNKNMDINNTELFKTVLNVRVGLFKRLKAINQLDLSNSKEIVNELIKILNRQKTDPIPDLIDSDPVADERIIDLHIIGLLNKLKNTTENSRISVLVSKAIPFIREYDDERKIDAKIIKSINNKEVFSNIISLTRINDPVIIENAVVVLNNLKFPNAPVSGDVSFMLPPTRFKFKFSYLKDEMDLYVNKSEGKIQLSEGVKKFVESNNIQRANDNEFVEYESSLIEVLEKNISDIFDYYIEGNKIIICTHIESAKKWQNWWDVNKEKF